MSQTLGRKCRDLKRDLAAAEADLSAIGTRRVVDPAGERIEAVSGGLWSAAAYRKAHPVITAATLELSCWLLLAVAGLIWSPARIRETRVEVIVPEPIDPIVRALQISGPMCNRDLARTLCLPEPRVSERVRLLEHAGTVRCERQGRQKVISVA